MRRVSYWRLPMTDTTLIEEMRKAKVRLKGISLGSEMDICVVEHSTVLIDLAIAALEQSQWVSVDQFDYNVSHICIIAWARKMPMSMGSYEDGYFTLYDTEDCGIFEGDAEWFKDNFEFYMPSPLQPARSST